MDKYPYLYVGFRTIGDFRRKYCPVNLLSRGRFLECNNVPSIDDGDLAGRFEKFVRDYTGLDPFDVQYVVRPHPCFSFALPYYVIATNRKVQFPRSAFTRNLRSVFRFHLCESFSCIKPEPSGIQPSIHHRRTLPVHCHLQFHGRREGMAGNRETARGGDT